MGVVDTALLARATECEGGVGGIGGVYILVDMGLVEIDIDSYR